MTKDLLFDLEFSLIHDELSILSLSLRGAEFLLDRVEESGSLDGTYQAAINHGLHVRFANKETRDQLSSVPLSESGS